MRTPPEDNGRENDARLTRAQRTAILRIDNILANGAKPHDFEGTIRELRGEVTGFDHVTEMRNNVRGLRYAIASITGSLANPHLPEDARVRLEAAKAKGQAALERMFVALTGPS